MWLRSRIMDCTLEEGSAAGIDALSLAESPRIGPSGTAGSEESERRRFDCFLGRAPMVICRTI